MEEIWKDIEGYEGLYQISNLGRVRSLKRYINNGTGTRSLKERMLKPLLINKYYSVSLYKNKKQRMFKVHRLVAQTFISNPNNKPFVNHIDGNKLNNRAYNLEWVTASENTQHAYTNGLIDKEKISKNHADLSGKNHPFYGKHLSEETKKKIGKSRKGKCLGDEHPQSKKVLCINTGEIFGCSREAEEKYNVKGIGACCRGVRKSAGKHPITGEKLRWEYI